MSDAPPLRRIGRVSRVVVGALVVAAAADAGALVTEAQYLDVLDDLAAGADLTADEVTSVEQRAGVAAIVQLAAYLLAVVTFLVWFRRGYRNLPRLGVVPRFGLGWAVGAWFVPILNLFRPKQLANDIWRASGPDEVAGVATGWQARPVGAIVHWWWAAFLISGWMSNIAGRGFIRAESVSEQQSATQLSIASDAVSIVAAVLAILFVRATTARQEARIDRTEAEPGPPRAADSTVAGPATVADDGE